MRRLLLLTTCALPLIPLAASADTALTYQTQQGEKLAIEHHDAKTLRIGTGKESYMLFRDGKRYACSREGGTWRVMDMDSMPKMGGKAAPAGAQDTVVEPTGQTETVAGVPGEVYRVTSTDPKTGAKETRTMVLTRDKRITTVWFDWMTAMAKMADNMQGQGVGARMAETKKMRDMGLAPLKSGKELLLLSVESGKGDPARFELPAKPQQMPAMPAGMGPGGPGGRMPDLEELKRRYQQGE